MKTAGRIYDGIGIDKNEAELSDWCGWLKNSRWRTILKMCRSDTSASIKAGGFEDTFAIIKIEQDYGKIIDRRRRLIELAFTNSHIESLNRQA